MYFVGVAIGGFVVVFRAPEMLGEYLAYIGAPTTATVALYCWKAREENKIKLMELAREKKLKGYAPENGGE